jgi:hypothetical protein
MNPFQLVPAILFFIGMPTVVMGFLYIILRNKDKVEIIKYKKELAALELANNELKLRVLETENRHYDRIINEK